MSNPPMQSLKFRAVDPETGQVSTIDFLKFSLGRWMEESDYKDLQVNFSFFEGFTFPSPAKIGDLRQLVLCQFTGLTDYYGNEVYAGDVLMWDGFMYRVEWDAENARYQFNALPNQPGMELIYTDIDADQVKTSAVVSNLWVTPESLLQRAIEIKRSGAERGGI